MKGVILAAGIGSRLAPYTDLIPKALMPISLDEQGRFRSIIEQIIHQISLAGITEIVIVVNHRAEMIENYLGSGSRLGVRLSYVRQEVLDGNGGAFYQAQPWFEPGDDVFLTDCDNFLSDELVIRKFTKFHCNGEYALSVATFPVSRTDKYAIIRVGQSGRPLEVYEKPEDADYWGNIAKSGMMILSAELAGSNREIARTGQGEYTTTQILSYALKRQLPVGLFPIPCQFTDVGTWGDYTGVLRSQLCPEQEVSG